MKEKPAVLISLCPKPCDLIVHGKQTAIIFRRRPLIDPPFKCYIYQKNSDEYISEFGVKNTLRSEKVIGEFVCDSITHLGNVAYDSWDRLYGDVYDLHKSIVVDQACMTEDDIHKSGGKYAFHVSKFELYGYPKDVCCFHNYKLRSSLKKAPITWCYVNII